MSKIKSIPFISLDGQSSRNLVQSNGINMSLECSLKQKNADGGIRLNIILENTGNFRKIKDPMDFLYPSICDADGIPIQIQNTRSIKYFIKEKAEIRPAFEVISVINKAGEDIKHTLEDDILELEADEKLNFQVCIKHILNRDEILSSPTPSTLEIPKGKYTIQLRMLIVPIVENETMTTFETDKLIVTIN